MSHHCVSDGWIENAFGDYCKQPKLYITLSVWIGLHTNNSFFCLEQLWATLGLRSCTCMAWWERPRHRRMGWEIEQGTLGGMSTELWSQWQAGCAFDILWESAQWMGARAAASALNMNSIGNVFSAIHKSLGLPSYPATSIPIESCLYIHVFYRVPCYKVCCGIPPHCVEWNLAPGKSGSWVTGTNISVI